MDYKGNILLIVGIIIILATLYEGYELYESIQLNNMIFQTTSPSVSSSSTVNATLTNLDLNINEVLRTSSDYLIEIVILFLFASIGYKISYLGVTILLGKNKSKTSSKEEQTNK
ncbi:MAG: hypothetical protein ACP5RI_00830 [Candidatus Micrarchaeia archaeon]